MPSLRSKLDRTWRHIRIKTARRYGLNHHCGPLMSLPREIRDLILVYIISAERPAPGNAELEKRVNYVKPKNARRITCSHTIMHHDDFHILNEIPTLLVNRQLRDETLEAIRLLPTKHCYHLDIVIASERCLCPSWLFLPEVTTKVETVRASLRTEMLGPKGSGFDLGCGGPSLMTWFFYGLLVGFLEEGPVGLRWKKVNCGRRAAEEDLVEKYCIETLEIDVLSPNIKEQPVDDDSRGSGPFSRLRYPVTVSSDALEYGSLLLNYLSTNIKRLLYMDSDILYYGDILYERIGRIKLLLNGNMKKEWDLAKALRDVEFCKYNSWDREQQRREFAEWKSKAYRTRIELGLPVLKNPRLVVTESQPRSEDAP